MIIKSASKDYFFWKMDQEEHEFPESAAFRENVKKEIPYGPGGRYWIKNKKIWAIHKNQFKIFMEIVYDFYRDLVFKQGELF